MTVTVAMPYYRTPALVGRAVRSVLAQTERDIRVVVVGDGEEPPLGDIRDPRLTVYTLPENRGTYFAHQLVLEATPDYLYAIVATDDWVEPRHLAHLMLHRRKGHACLPAWVTHHSGPHDRKGRARNRRQIVGLFVTSSLLALGGFNPAERLSQDTLMVRLLDLTYGVRAAPLPATYHWVRRPDSLTRAPETNHRSPARTAARARWQAVRDACVRLGTVEAMRAYRESLVPPEVRADLDVHVARLRALLTR